MSRTVDLVRELCAYDTRNPDGHEPKLAARLADLLGRHGADQVQLVEVPRKVHGGDALLRPGAYVLARWGTPRLLINAHLDTVPANTGWSGDPLVARVADGRVTALGACDIKGAIAAILAALESGVRPHDTAILFSGDEEHGGRVMAQVMAAGALAGVERALVCEPTSLRAGTRHRGIVALELSVHGAGGHSSGADRMPSPIAELARVAVAFDAWAKLRRDAGPPGFTGTCMNLARLDGGVAFNVVPDAATLHVSLRPAPGVDAAAVIQELGELARRCAPGVQQRVVFQNASFATRDLTGFASLLGQEVVDAPVDLAFWTEAALLSAAGVDCVVIGPGDIAQAHAPDEWVAVDQLERARALFEKVLGGRL
jgi:acetylornithine deacetylase